MLMYSKDLHFQLVSTTPPNKVQSEQIHFCSSCQYETGSFSSDNTYPLDQPMLGEDYRVEN